MSLASAIAKRAEAKAQTLGYPSVADYIREHFEANESYYDMGAALGLNGDIIGDRARALGLKRGRAWAAQHVGHARGKARPKTVSSRPRATRAFAAVCGDRIVALLDSGRLPECARPAAWGSLQRLARLEESR